MASLSLGPLRRRVLVPIYNILIRIEEEEVEDIYQWVREAQVGQE
jgi:hypothetical protein